MKIEQKSFLSSNIDRLLICDIDNTLIGDSKSLELLLERLQQASDYIGFGVATGRNIGLTLSVLKEWTIPMPGILITSVGSEINYGADLIPDQSWENHINNQWDPEAVQEGMKYIPGIRLQPPEGQRQYKISYIVDADRAPNIEEIKDHLKKLRLHVNLIYSHQEFLDILPMRASKGKAIHYLSENLKLSLQRILVAGDSGNDEEMLMGNTLAVVVGNHSPELNKLRGSHQIYFAKSHFAGGILEAIDYYDFFGNIKIP